MDRHRLSSPPATFRKKKGTFSSYTCETLEERQLLTVLVGGDTFTWRGPDTNLDTIQVSGVPSSAELEIVGLRINNETGQQFLDNLPGRLDGAPVFGGIQPIQQTLPPPPPGPNPIFVTRPPYFADTIWEIYVVQSSPTTSISAEEYDINGNPLDFTTSIGSLHVTNRGEVAAPANSGALLLGGRTISIVGSTNNPNVPPPPAIIPNIPIYSAGIASGTPFALIPSGTTLLPGVDVTAANDFGNFYWGGTILGSMQFGGSLGVFYAGWLLGTTNDGATNAFSVAGNAEAIISLGSIGTDNATLEGGALFDTGFNLVVGGRLGEVRTTGDFLGAVSVAGSNTIPGAEGGSTAPVNEIEARVNDAPPADLLPSFQLGNNAVSYNDTFNTPEILPVTATGTASVNGSLDVGPTVSDYVDYYGIALMAGQTITVQLQSVPVQPQEPIDVGVFDPDGVLVASDYNLAGYAYTNQQPFEYTAVKAGLYRFAVAEDGDGTFASSGPFLGTFPYNLTVSNIGNVTFGGLLAYGTIRDINPVGTAGFQDSNGDLGAVMAIGGILESEDTDTFEVDNGNLRAVQGTSLDDSGILKRPVTLAVANGSVGLLSATAGTLSVLVDPAVPVGGNMQIISASGSAYVDLNVDGSLGVLRAGDMATTLGASIINVNYLQNLNTPATIDLIDVTGDLGTLSTGGPAITTGPGGNVRYMVVGGNVYEDSFFGGSFPTATQYQQGESVQIVDDSGTVVNMTPNPAVTNVNTGAVTTPAGQLTVTAYGIEGSGGSAIINVTSTGSVTITGQGNSPNQTAEIGTIVEQGIGTAVIPGTTPTTAAGSGSGGNGTGSTGVQGFGVPGSPGGPPIKTNSGGNGSNGSLFVAIPPAPVLPTTGQQLNLMINGNAKVGVWAVNGSNFSSVENQTPGGELVNMTAFSVGTLSSAGSIGMVTGSVGEQVNGPTVFNNTYPFNDQTYGLNVVAPGGTGGIVSLSAQQFGNINVGTYGIGSISGDNTGPVVTTGQINSVSLTGMTWAGSGFVGQSGLYAAMAIGNVTSSGDIRGNIVSQTGLLSLAVRNGGSLDNAVVLQSTNYASASAVGPGIATTSVPSPITRPIHQIGNVTVSGNGGIIGSYIAAEHIGTVTSGGFGVFGSTVQSGGDGTIDGLIGSGYGLRFSNVIGGASAGTVAAVGNGSLVPTSNFSASVRQSETGATFDPNTGLLLSPLNDIDISLGVTAAAPEEVGVTDTGVIENVTIEGSRSVTMISAYEIRGRAITIGGLLYNLESVFDVANQINTLQTKGGIDGLTITVGRVLNFKAAGDVSNFTGQFAGAVNRLVFNSNLDASSVIQATGPNGHIGTLIIDGNLAGTVYARTFITDLEVHGAITGTVTAARIGTIHVTGAVASGGLTVNGPINNLIVDGSFGPAGSPITVNGNAGNIRIKGDLAANLSVTGNVKELMVGGSILTNSDSTIGGILNLLQVAGDVQAGAIVQAELIKRQVVKGQILGTIMP